MSIHSSLIVDRSAIPAAAAVVARLKAHGHTASFPKKFEFSDDGHVLWVPMTLDSEKTGFDYCLSPVASYTDEEPEVAEMLATAGNHELGFGARGQASARAVAIVQRAIVELSGASGWIGEELVPSPDMGDYCTGVLKSVEDLALLPPPPPLSKKEQKAAAKAFWDKNPRQPAQRNYRKTAIWVAIYAVAALSGWFIATANG